MLGPLAQGIVAVLQIVLNMIQVLILASIIISWVNADPSNQIVSMIRSMTEPLYRPIRRLTRNLPGPFDWAPLILMLLVVFVDRGILPYILMLGGSQAVQP